MNKLMKRWISILLLAAVLPLLGSCDREDDVMEIFTGKTWKLSYIALEGTNEPYDFWGENTTAKENSLKALAQTNSFTLEFEGVAQGETVSGNFNARVIRASIEGTWQADGKERTFTTARVSQNGQETDVLAQAFLRGLQNAFRYEGDADNLFIYYRNGQDVMRLGFVPLQ